ncbi:hypothetical protein ACFWFF_17250 [Streptomyces sp. NPDC060223]|uniref:hypothetical protein n=1 Tax=unclassified Streptomyces TaxID=2593676 RepID=UPI00363AEE51
MASTDRRRLHFVGSLPQFDDATSAFRWQQHELAGRVRRLSGGETGPRLQWFVPLVKAIKALPHIRTVQDGEWTGYDDTDRLKVQRGSRLTPGDIPMRLSEYAREELAALDALGTPASADLPLQVGVPGYLDMALFIFGPVGVFRHARAFRDATAGQIADVHRTAGDALVFQLEVPAALIAVVSAPRPLRPLLARLMARLVTSQVSKAPQGSRFGVHLCLGDLGHRALKIPSSAAPQAVLANALVRRWPQGRPLEFVHLPLSGGDQPPVTSTAYYAPLRRLRVPSDVSVVAGIAHEEQPAGDQLAVRALVEEALGRRTDIATACGLGRRTSEQAARAVDSMRVLLDDEK